MKNLLNNSNLSMEEFNDLFDDSRMTPSRLPMKFQMDKNDKVRIQWEDPWEPSHDNYKYFSYCRRIESLLENSIGKPYSEIYSKVCHEYPDLYNWGTNLKKFFKDNFIPKTYWRGIGNHYYIDDDGLIQFYEQDQTKRKPKIVIIDPTRKPSYEVQHHEFQNHSKLMNELYYTLGARKYYQLIDSKEISEKFYNEIISILPIDLISEFKEIVHYMVWRYTWNKGDSGYKKMRAESEDDKKKREREYKILREQQKENLIQYIEWQRKNKNLQDDDVTRDRHGFDEESFKGEFYHGQKRKKNSA